MKVVILAGGLGTRISEESKVNPKPLIKIGRQPIIWHIMKNYSHFGFNEFIICLGYKGYMIKKKLSKIALKERWKVDLINTGSKTMTGGRIKRVFKYLKNEENFCMTYGDGISNVNIKNLVKFHIKHKKIATVTVVKEPNRFGILSINKNNYLVKKIKEKPNDFINGGFFVLSKKIFHHIKNDQSIFEGESLPRLARSKQLISFKHNGFWSCMDTLRDKKRINKMWNNKDHPWKLWNEK
jgi:glucose-1-phosphate cytidylyltransferase